jgi:hypothetical protein
MQDDTLGARQSVTNIGYLIEDGSAGHVGVDSVAARIFAQIRCGGERFGQ